MVDYFDLSYKKLQSELKTRGLKASGKKDDLISRLEEDDKNNINLEQAEDDIESNINIKMFHVKTLIGFWYDVNLRNDQTMDDLLEILNEKTGAPIDKIRLTTQDGKKVESNCRVDVFVTSDIYLNMRISFL